MDTHLKELLAFTFITTESLDTVGLGWFEVKRPSQHY